MYGGGGDLVRKSLLPRSVETSFDMWSCYFFIHISHKRILNKKLDCMADYVYAYLTIKIHYIA